MDVREQTQALGPWACGEMIILRAGVGPLAKLALLIVLLVVTPYRSAPEAKGGPSAMRPEEGARMPAVAGAFYSGDRGALGGEIDGFLSNAKPIVLQGDPKALVCPHAGYLYSGQVAAFAYALLRGRKLDTVVVLGPSHRTYFEGVAVYNRGAWLTPLGTVPIDEDLADRIIQQNPSLVRPLLEPHQAEHSIEVQVPFIQRVLPAARLVPVMMADQSEETCRKLGAALGRALEGRNAILVASTDLYHGYSYEADRRSDALFVQDLEAFAPERLARNLASEKTQACGGGPVVAALIAAKAQGATAVKILKHTNSGDVTGEKSGYIVGYVSAVAYTPAKK
jgi:AmmeMemoRadiSam system protein B